MLWLIIVLCLIGIKKGIDAWFGCIKSDALIPALNMFLMTLLFTAVIMISLYIMMNYNITEKFVL